MGGLTTSARRRTPGRWQPQTLLALLVVLLTITAAVGTAAPLAATAQADVAFEQPTASGAFGEPLAFRTGFGGAAPPQRVELLTNVPGEDGLRVTIADLQQTGADTWQASVVQGGHVVPNTTFEFRFRVVTDDGSFLGPEGSHRVLDERFEWQRLAGDGVEVWWHRGDRAFAERALGIAEEAIASASELLGVGDIEPVDFIIYSDDRSFRQAMGPGTRENVGGQAHPDIRTLFGLIGPRQVGSDWVEELVTHELAHLVFDEAVRNPYTYPPRWLNEGLAVYLAVGYRDADRAQVDGAARAGTIIPLDGLGGQFPTRPDRFGLAYAESVSAVAFFVKAHGEEQLVELITSFSDGIGLDEAFEAATGSDFAAFDDAWLDSVGAERPEALGPRPAEPGPTPEAWGALGGPLLP